MNLTAPQRMQRLTTKQMLEQYGNISKPTLWRHIRQGLIPKPRYLKPKCPFWLLGDIEDHDERMLKGAKTIERPKADEHTHEKEESIAPPGSVVSKLRSRLGL